MTASASGPSRCSFWITSPSAGTIPDLIADLVEGVSAGCVEAGAALLGGETAIMPDVYAGEDFDMAGFCVGVVERDQAHRRLKDRCGR